MKQYGLIGYPLSHTFSPGYFARKFENESILDSRYDAYELRNISEFADLANHNLSGLNVTIPYKEEVIPYLDDLSDEARAIGAVNTILFNGSQKIGFNTDVYGFQKSLEGFCQSCRSLNGALVLGSGGASKAVTFVLDRLGIRYLVVSRSKGHIRYEDIEEEQMTQHNLIVNTTPLGMHPNVEDHPSIPYHLVGEAHYFFDLIYNPAKTTFLIKAEEKGARIKNGLEMLELQAEKSWEIWQSVHS